MDFEKRVKITYTDIPIEDYFNGNCPKCNSKNLKIRTSRKRRIKELGTPLEKRFICIKVVKYQCNECGNRFSPKHPDFHPNYTYTPSVLLYALERYHQNNISGNEIGYELRNFHNVDVPDDTVYTWIKILSEDYLNSISKTKFIEDPETIKTITIDGTFVSTGKDIVGKKKRVDLLSVTKEKGGTYALMWSERRI